MASRAVMSAAQLRLPSGLKAINQEKPEGCSASPYGVTCLTEGFPCPRHMRPLAAHIRGAPLHPVDAPGVSALTRQGWDPSSTWEAADVLLNRPASELQLEANGAQTTSSSGIGFRRLVHLDDNIGSADLVRRTMGTACFAAISAHTYKPPPQPLDRPTIKPAWVTGGVLLTVVAGIAWFIHQSETYARQQLLYERTEDVITPLPSPEMLERYERALASVEQTGMINRAVAALRSNNFIKCVIEIELALEQNRTARRSITPDFYEEGELSQLYRSALKSWLDGYPLDYGRLLQLREMLAIPSDEAEAIEAEVQGQSDVYVI